MAYPAAPADGDFHVEDGIRRRWVDADQAWIKDPTPGERSAPQTFTYTADGNANSATVVPLGWTHNLNTTTPTVSLFVGDQLIADGWVANIDPGGNVISSIEYPTSPGASPPANGDVVTIKVSA